MAKYRTCEKAILGGVMEEAPGLYDRDDIFEDGLKHLFYNWTVIELALKHSFAGPNTAVMVHEFAEDLIDAFPVLPSIVLEEGPAYYALLSKVPSLDMLWGELNEFISNDLSVVLEDDSGRGLLNDILYMYGSCAKGNYEQAEKAKAIFTKKYPEGFPSLPSLFEKRYGSWPSKSKADNTDEDGWTKVKRT